MSRKEFGTGADTDHLADVLATRFATPEPEPEPEPDPAPAETPAPPRMTTRSWYLPRETADQLAAAAERLRHTVPAVSKAEALDSLLRVALDHEEQACQALRDSRKQ